MRCHEREVVDVHTWDLHLKVCKESNNAQVYEDDELFGLLLFPVFLNGQ